MVEKKRDRANSEKMFALDSPAPNFIFRPRVEESPMTSTTTKLYKNSKRRKTKPQPVTSGSKSDTPGLSMIMNLNLPLGRDDLNAKSNSGPDPAPIDLPSQPTSFSLLSSRQTGEPEPEPALNVIGTPYSILPGLA